MLLIELSIINLDLVSEQRKPMEEFKERGSTGKRREERTDQ